MKSLAVHFVCVLAGLLGFNVTGQAVVTREVVEYKQGDTILEGVLVRDTNAKGKRPAVLVVHDWLGLTEKTLARADQVAKLGYVVFAADIYGKGIRAKDQQEANKLATKFKEDRPLFRARLQAALTRMSGEKSVDTNRLAAIGYCFGGTGVLELARSGAPVAGVVSFHGGLATPNVQDAAKIKGKVLVLHGADDPWVPDAEVTAFENEMRLAKVDWRLTKYGGAVHSFTDQSAGLDNSKGAAYNEAADRRSWQEMRYFFTELFSGAK